MRLEQCLGQAGFGSRNQVKKLLKARQVTVEGAVATEASRIVDPTIQTICVRGDKVDMAGSVYYLLNKPAGVVTAVSDSRHQTVIDLIAEKDKVTGLYPLGRLDRDTEGLLLLTNNGPLGFRMLHPKHHVTKVYEVAVNGYLGDDALDFFAKGVVFLDGTRCQPADLTILSRSDKLSRARVRLSEGKFHQVKKMFLAYGVKVVSLKRTAFGPFALDDQLASGSYRPLTTAEKALLLPFFD